MWIWLSLIVYSMMKRLKHLIKANNDMIIETDQFTDDNDYYELSNNCPSVKYMHIDFMLLLTSIQWFRG